MLLVLPERSHYYCKHEVDKANNLKAGYWRAAYAGTSILAILHLYWLWQYSSKLALAESTSIGEQYNRNL